MKKKSKAIFMALLTAVLLVATPLVAFADHNDPITHEQCNDASLEYSHAGVAGSYHVSQHMLSDGRYCTITQVGHTHFISCGECPFIVHGVSMECEENHSLCGGTKIVH